METTECHLATCHQMEPLKLETTLASFLKIIKIKLLKDYYLLKIKMAISNNQVAEFDILLF